MAVDTAKTSDTSPDTTALLLSLPNKCTTRRSSSLRATMAITTHPTSIHGAISPRWSGLVPPTSAVSLPIVPISGARALVETPITLFATTALLVCIPSIQFHLMYRVQC